MKNIKYIKVDGNEIALKFYPTKNRYRVVYPWKNKDGSWNWFNVFTGGSWMNLLLVIGLILIITGAIMEYVGNINTLLDCFRVPGMLQRCIEVFTPENMTNLAGNYTLP